MSGEGSEGGGTANVPGQGEGGGVTATLFTQDQVNHFNAEARRKALGDFFKEVGLDAPLSAEDLKGSLGKAGEFDKLQEGQQSDVEKLTGQLNEANKKAERVPVLEADLLKAQIAADEGLKSRYWKYVEGKSEDEIKDSVKAVLADVGASGQDQDQHQQPGARTPAPNPQQGTGGGQPPKKTMQSGAEAYAARHKRSSPE